MPLRLSLLSKLMYFGLIYSVQVLVTFMGTDDIKVDTIRNLYGKIMNQQSLSGLIVVIQSKMTAFAVKELQKWPFKVEIFKVSFKFQINYVNQYLK